MRFTFNTERDVSFILALFIVDGFIFTVDEPAARNCSAYYYLLCAGKRRNATTEKQGCQIEMCEIDAHVPND